MSVTYGTSTDITFASLNGLTADTWAESGQVNLSSSNAQDCIVGGKVKTDAAGWADGDYLEVYVVVPWDKANPTTTIGGSVGTGLDGTDSTETESGGGAFMKENLILARRITVDADASKEYHMVPFSLVNVLGYMPPYFSLMVWNSDISDTLDATDGGQFMYTTITYA